jgi:hypothetical protein
LFEPRRHPHVSGVRAAGERVHRNLWKEKRQSKERGGEMAIRSTALITK